MFHIIRSRAKLLLGLLVIMTLVLSVGFLTTHPTIKAHADDGDPTSVTFDAPASGIHGDDATDYSADSPVATTVPLTRWYDPVAGKVTVAGIASPAGCCAVLVNPFIVDYGIHYLSTTTDGKDIQSNTATAEGSGIGNMGYIYSTPHDGATGLYSCYTENRYSEEFQRAVLVLNGGNKISMTINFDVYQYFGSTDSNCEGQRRDQNFRTGPMGYILTAPVDNSQPLYRCYVPGLNHGGSDHFVTHDPNCERGPGSNISVDNGGQPFGWTLNSPA